jgi:hypothetical protein
MLDIMTISKKLIDRVLSTVVFQADTSFKENDRQKVDLFWLKLRTKGWPFWRKWSTKGRHFWWKWSTKVDLSWLKWSTKSRPFLTKMIDKKSTFLDENDRQKVTLVAWDYLTEKWSSKTYYFEKWGEISCQFLPLGGGLVPRYVLQL